MPPRALPRPCTLAGAHVHTHRMAVDPARPAHAQIDFNSTPAIRQAYHAIQEQSRFLSNPETYWGPKVRCVSDARA